MKFSFAAMGVSVVLVGGCASQGGPMNDSNRPGCRAGTINDVALEESLAKSKPCCTSYAGMSFTKPVPSEPLTVGPDAPSYDFPTGRSRFAALDLTEFKQKQLVLMPANAGQGHRGDSECRTGVYSPQAPYGETRVVAPRLVWLDAAKQVLVEGVAARPVVFREGGEFQEVGWVARRPEGASYAVLYADASQFGTPVTINAAIGKRLVMVGIGMMVPVDAGGPRTLLQASTGRFDPLVYAPNDALLAAQCRSRASSSACDNRPEYTWAEAHGVKEP